MKEIFITMFFDILPILVVLFFFQFLVLRQIPTKMGSIVLGFVFVWAGLSLFLIGLEKSLFPLGELMAKQLTSKNFINADTTNWLNYFWVYIFAMMIGFATTIAEPSLFAVAVKVGQISGGSIKPWGFRVVVAIGVALGISLGSYRIISGIPLYYSLIIGYLFVLIQTYFTPKNIISIAYDAGGVTTSTVTVPLVVALGIGLSQSLEHSNPLVDSLGLIAFASLFPIISVMTYMQLLSILKLKKKIKIDATKKLSE